MSACVVCWGFLTHYLRENVLTEPLLCFESFNVVMLMLPRQPTLNTACDVSAHTNNEEGELVDILTFSFIHNHAHLITPVTMASEFAAVGQKESSSMTRILKVTGEELSELKDIKHVHVLSTYDRHMKPRKGCCKATMRRTRTPGNYSGGWVGW